MIKNDTALEHLNETYVLFLIYILQNLEGHLCFVQSLISFLNNSSNVPILIALGTNSQIFGAWEDIVSVRKYTERLNLRFRVESFLILSRWLSLSKESWF